MCPTLWQTFRVCQSFTRWRERVARAYHNSLVNWCAPHFGKLSEFDKVLSFGASRTGFYQSEWAVCTVSSSIANAVRSQLDTSDSISLLIYKLRCKVHKSLLSFYSAKITKKLTIKFFYLTPISKFRIQNSFFPHPQFKIQNSKFKILKVLKTVLISIFVIRRCYSFIP